MPEELVLKDSGSRDVYPSGAQRDNREGKGRFDLVSGQGLLRLSRIYRACIVTGKQIGRAHV